MSAPSASPLGVPLVGSPREADRPVWMSGPVFDVGLLAGAVWLPVVLAVAWFDVLVPAAAFLMLKVLVFDPHFASTYLRLYGDPTERHHHWKLGFVLPIAIGLVLGLAAWVVPLGALGFALYHWQFWHTVRQSYGVLRVYQARRGTVGSAHGRLEVAALWAMPLLGLVSQWRVGSSDYLGLPKPELPVPMPLLLAAAAMTFAVLLAYVASAIVRRLQGHALPTAELSFIGLSTAVFAVGPFILRDLVWDNLMLSLYHSTQYVAFAALFQRKKAAGPGFEGGVIAWAAQPWSWARYALLVLVIGVLQASLVRHAVPGLVSSVLALAMIDWTLRVHHYMVDARIWKLGRAPGVAQVLGVKPSPTST